MNREETIQRLEQASNEFANAHQAEQAARENLAQTIVEAATIKVRQVDIVRITGYTRESIRRICRNAGLMADD